MHYICVFARLALDGCAIAFVLCTVTSKAAQFVRIISLPYPRSVAWQTDQVQGVRVGGMEYVEFAAESAYASCVADLSFSRSSAAA